MKKINLIELVVGSMILAGCANDTETENTSEGSNNQETENTSENATESNNQEENEESIEELEKGNMYDIEDVIEWEGWTFTVKQIVTQDDFESEWKDEKVNIISFNVSLTNNTEEVMSQYFDQAVLITNTGEQIESADLLLSDHIGGDTHGGVTKDGIMTFILSGSAEEVENVKLEFPAYDGEMLETETTREELLFDIDLN